VNSGRSKGAAQAPPVNLGFYRETNHLTTCRRRLAGFWMGEV